MIKASEETPLEQTNALPEDRPDDPIAGTPGVASPRGKAPKPKKDVKYKGTGFAWLWLGWLIVMIAILPVVVQNTQIVQVRYLIWDIRSPLAAGFLAIALVAGVATEIIGWAWRVRRRRELTMKAELKELKRKTASDA